MVDGMSDGSRAAQDRSDDHKGGTASVRPVKPAASGSPKTGRNGFAADEAKSGPEPGFDSWKGALLALGIYTVAAVIGSAIRYVFTKKAVKNALRETGLAR